jgi:hypothetical protein
MVDRVGNLQNAQRWVDHGIEVLRRSWDTDDKEVCQRLSNNACRMTFSSVFSGIGGLPIKF